MKTLSQNYLEENKEEPDSKDGLFGLFQVDFENYLKIKFAFMYHLHLAPSEIDALPYWEYEEFIELLSDVLKKKQEAENKGSHQQQSSMNPSTEASKMMGKMKSSMPKFK